MIQGGDPTGDFFIKTVLVRPTSNHIFAGTGKGGESIYGKYFADEIHESLKFTARYWHFPFMCVE
jgi:cyclophilin family peptidyl-prolyl cis-trans isomerase